MLRHAADVRRAAARRRAGAAGDEAAPARSSRPAAQARPRTPPPTDRTPAHRARRPRGLGEDLPARRVVRGAHDARVAWVALDTGDDHPVLFWSYVLAALRQSLPGIGERALRALPAGGRAIRDAAVPLLVNDLVAQPGPIVLVLDDYHVITDRVVHETVTLLVERLPEHVHVVVATRGNPPLPLGRLRAAGELQELRTDDLAFDDRRGHPGAHRRPRGRSRRGRGGPPRPAHRGLAGRRRARGGVAGRARRRRRRLRRGVHRHRPLRPGLPRHRGARRASRQTCGSSSCAPPSCAGSRPSRAGPSPVAPTPPHSSTARSGRASSSARSTPGVDGSATTGCSASCSATSWPSPSRPSCPPSIAGPRPGRRRPGPSGTRWPTTSPPGTPGRRRSSSPRPGRSGSTRGA